MITYPNQEYAYFSAPAIRVLHHREEAITKQRIEQIITEAINRYASLQNHIVNPIIIGINI